MKMVKKQFIILPILFLVILSLFVYFTRNIHTKMHPFYVDILERFVAFGSDDLKTLTSVLRYLNALYVNETRLDAQKMWIAGAKQLQKRVADLIVDTENDNNVKIIVNGVSKNFDTGKIKDFDTLFEYCKDLFTHTAKNTKEKIERNEIKDTMIEGLLTPLDPHTVYMTPDIYREMEIDTVGEFGGLGIIISIRDGFLTIISPIEDTPAYRAGLKSRDRIMVIDGESTINMSLLDAVKKMRGPKNTFVELAISRKDNPELINYKLKREIINIKSVKSKLLDNNIGYLKIKIFQNNSSKEVTDALKLLDKDKKLAGLILDLRNNPGGPLDQAIEVSDIFVDEGTIVSTVAKGNSEINAKRATSGGLRSDCPLVVLINEGSASASEIVAGAIKYLGRGIILGTTSFGKGSVQQVERFSDGSALKLTVAQYLAAGVKSIHGIGIIPDILLDPIYIGKDEIDLFYHKNDSENDKEALFDTKYETSKLSKPTYTLKYLYSAENRKSENKTGEKDDKDDDDSYYQASDIIDISKDYLLGFSVRLLSEFKKISKPKITLSDIGNLINSESEQNDKIITSELSKEGIDWTSGRTKDADLHIQKFSDNFNAKSGEELSIPIELINKSSFPIFRCYAVTKSKSPILNDREFILGQIKPNETKKRVFSLKIPAKTIDGARDFSLSFSDECGKVTGNTTALVEIKSKERPILAFKYVIQNLQGDDKKSEKKIGIKLFTKNEGRGDAEDAIAAIKNLNGKGVFIENGRVSFGKVKKGEIKEGNFSFKVLKEHTKNTLEFTLTIADMEFDYFFSKNILINLPIKEDANNAIDFYSPPLLQNVKNECLLNKFKDNCLFEGRAESEVGLKDLMLFIDEEKTMYLRGGKDSIKTAIDFKEKIKLKDDDAEVILIARDINDVSSNQSFYIVK